MKHEAFVQWCDKRLTEIEAQADKINYNIDVDDEYVAVVDIITSISFDEIDPTTKDWMSIAYKLGSIQGRLHQKQRIG